MSKKAKTIVKRILSVFFGIIVVILGYFIIANIVAAKNNTISSFFGYSISYVPTNSMEPTISHGSSVMFEKNTKYEDIHQNDIIVYKNEELNIYVIHKVYEKTSLGLVMKGDNNPIIDYKQDGTILYVTSENYVGKYVTTISAFSIETPFARTLILIISLLAFGFIISSEAFAIYKAKKEEKEELSQDDKDKLKKELLEELKNEMKNEDK